MPRVDLTSTTGIQQYLHDNGHTCDSVERLAEGFSGFVYRAVLRGTSAKHSSVIVKHVEGYAARWPDFKIGQDRMNFEAKALSFLGQPQFNDAHASIRVPSLISFDEDSYILMMEDMGDLPSLKSWLQATSPADHITSIGQTLGTYLAHVHNETATDSLLRMEFSSNIVGRNVSSSLYFGGLPTAAAKYGYTDPFIIAAANAAEAEVLTASEVWTLGDFWTGNVLVSTPDDRSVQKLAVLDLELAKPGTAAFDIGQMGAEMLCLAHFRYPDQGHLLLKTFFGAYRAERKTSVDAAAVAIRIAAHLFTMMPRAWTAEAGEEKVKVALQQGYELLKIGWERDGPALRKSIVGVLMEQSVVNN